MKKLLNLTIAIIMITPQQAQALRPMAARMTDIGLAESNTLEARNIEQHLAALVHFKVIDVQEQRFLLEIVGLDENSRKIGELISEAYNKRIIERPDRRLIEGLLNKLDEKGLISFWKRRNIYTLKLNPKGIEAALDKAVASQLVGPFVRGLETELKSIFPLPEEADRDEFCTFLFERLKNWSETCLSFSYFDFGDLFYHRFYEVYQGLGITSLIDRIKICLLSSYRLERDIETVLQEPLFSAVQASGLPAGIDRIIFTYSETDRRPMRWYMLEGKRFLLVNNYVLDRVDVRLIRLSLLLTHILIGHPTFNYEGNPEFRNDELADRLGQGISPHPYLSGLKFDFSPFPKDYASRLNILDAICEMVAHKVTLALTEYQNISEEDKRVYLDTLASIYITRGGEKPEEGCVRGAHYAHIVAMAEILDVRLYSLEICEAKSKQLNGIRYHDLLVDYLKTFYKNLTVKIHELSSDYNPGADRGQNPGSIAPSLQKKSLTSSVIAECA